MFDLSGKVALITGASRGIGKEIALKMASLGAKIALNYAHNENAAEEVAKSIRDMGKEARIYRFDIANADEVDKACETIRNDFQGLDILVNNAGVAIDGLLLRLKEEDLDKQIDINLKGAFHCSRAVAKYMIKNRCGRIINISSIVGLTGNAGQSVYCATKAGLIGFTKALALELAGRNVLVNAVAPGFIETDMTKNILEKGSEEIMKKIPLGRAGRAEEVAMAVVYLASNEASYVTGQVLSVNGGMYL